MIQEPVNVSLREISAGQDICVEIINYHHLSTVELKDCRWFNNGDEDQFIINTPEAWLDQFEFEYQKWERCGSIICCFIRGYNRRCIFMISTISAIMITKEEGIELESLMNEAEEYLHAYIYYQE